MNFITAVGLFLLVLSSYAATVKTEAGKLEFVNQATNTNYRIGGNAAFDYAKFSLDKDHPEIYSSAKNGAARLAIEADLGDSWSFLSVFEFAEEDLEVLDAYITLHGEKYKFYFGQYGRFFGLENQTILPNLMFIKRSVLTETFGARRGLGFGMSRVYRKWGFHAGLFDEKIGNNETKAIISNGAVTVDNPKQRSWEYQTRIHWFPYEKDLNLFHLAISHAKETFRGGSTPALTPTMGSSALNFSLIGTGALTDTQAIARYGADLYFAWRSISFLGEYVTAATEVEKNSTATEYDFSGYSGTVSWFVTGEQRPYDKNTGRLGSIKPKRTYPRGKMGAWELLYRMAKVDLDDQSLAGGTQTNSTIGVNWYPHNNVKFQFNYVTVDSIKDSVEDKPQFMEFRTFVKF